jgi:hypothetical protein
MTCRFREAADKGREVEVKERDEGVCRSKVSKRGWKASDDSKRMIASAQTVAMAYSEISDEIDGVEGDSKQGRMG